MLQEAELEAESRREKMCSVLNEKNDLLSEVCCCLVVYFTFLLKTRLTPDRLVQRNLMNREI